MSWLDCVNDSIATKLTLTVGTIWSFYALVIFGFVPTFAPHLQETCLYWSNFIQLIFLPIIMVGQSVLGRTAKKQAHEDHEAIKMILGNTNEQIKLITNEI